MPIDDQGRGPGGMDRLLLGLGIAASVLLIGLAGTCTFAAAAARSPIVLLPLMFLAMGVAGVVQGVRKWRGETAAPGRPLPTVAATTGSILGGILMAIGALITAMAGISMLAGLVALGSDPDHLGKGLAIALGFGSAPVLLGLGVWFLGRKLRGDKR